MDIKKKAQGLLADAEAQNVTKFVEDTGNVYETLAVIANRANNISRHLKEELLAKLEEFAVANENLEEIHENKEQIEISRFYERLPNPALIATHEFLNHELHFRYRDEEGEGEKKKKVGKNTRVYQ